MTITESCKRWRHKNKQRIHERRIKNRLKNLARIKARKKIQIPHGQFCVICKMELATERHHPDYTQPLNVQFVCRTCNHNLNSKNQPKKLLHFYKSGAKYYVEKEIQSQIEKEFR